jgi:topoisomerase-4 subunit B
VEIVFRDQVNNSEQRWCYADGLNDYLCEAVNGLPLLPEKPFVGTFSGDTEAVDWALLWLPEGGAADRKLRQPDPDHAGRYPR